MKYLSRLHQVLESGIFTVTGEIGPPRHAGREAVRRHAGTLAGFVDAANITDCQTAVVRLSSIAAGVHVLDCGVEPVIQMACRDRNRIAIQADLLGAYSLGMKNLLCVSGDHQAFGNHPQAKNVYDLDSVQLVQMVRNMRDSQVFCNGEKIKSDAPGFYVGAVVNPFADPLEYRVDHLEKKIDAGAQFIQTQIVYDLERFESFMEEVVARGLDSRAHIMATVSPFKSWQAACYMRDRVPGMSVPDALVNRMKEAADQKAEGVDICTGIIDYVRRNISGVHGVHISAFAWEEIIPIIAQRAGLLPRPEYNPASTN